MSIKEFKESQDYKDICYMIKHVPFVSTRCDILRELGYKVSISIIKKPQIQVKYYTFIDSNNKIRIQISDVKKNEKYAWYVII